MTFEEWWHEYQRRPDTGIGRGVERAAREAWDAATKDANRRAEEAAEQDWKYGSPLC